MRSILPQFSEDTLELLVQLNRALGEQIGLRTKLESAVQLPEETIRRRSGTCRDFATLLMHACRALGFAARYVSGYRCDPGHPPNGGLHAWTEVYLPGAGWRGLDAAHGVMIDEHYVPVAIARSPENLAPVTGTFFGRTGVDTALKTVVDVRPQ
jgi:transglutaminase-like putative cysteine protease